MAARLPAGTTIIMPIPIWSQSVNLKFFRTFDRTGQICHTNNFDGGMSTISNYTSQHNSLCSTFELSEIVLYYHHISPPSLMISLSYSEFFHMYFLFQAASTRTTWYLRSSRLFVRSSNLVTRTSTFQNTRTILVLVSFILDSRNKQKFYQN